MNRISMQASSKLEMDMRIKDNEKRGWTLISRSDVITKWSHHKYTAVMERKEQG